MNYPEKVFWFDVETSGTNEHENGIIQLYGLAEIERDIEGEIELLINPDESLKIEPEALEINGYTEDELRTDHDDEPEAWDQLYSFFDEFIDPYESNDKFWIGGYNVNFDINFLTAFWERNKSAQTYLGSFVMRNRFLDPYPISNALIASGIIPRNEDAKLQTIASELLELGDGVDWHDARTDILVTRQLMRYLLTRMTGSVFQDDA